MERNQPELVTIFGGSGFVGTQIVQLLARQGYRIRVAVRRPDLAGHLKMVGAVGQIAPIQANVRNADSVLRAAKGAHIIINLAGIGHERGKQRFGAIHVAGARHVAEAATLVGATQLIHMSVLGASAESQSSARRSRALGEAAVREAYPEASIFRPSIIFGQGDGFFNRYGMLARLFPVLPLFGGTSRFQPVYVGDVAAAVALAAGGQVRAGRIYELGGPDIETHRMLVERVLEQARRHNLIVPLPAMVGRLLALPMGLLPNPLLTADQVSQLLTDNVVSDDASKTKRTLAAFGIAGTPMDAVLPSYLWRFRKHGQFEKQPA